MANLCIKKTACHAYSLTFLGVGGVFTGVVKTYEGTILENITEQDDSITLPNDGVFFIEITYDTTTEKYVVYDFCDLLTCVSGIIQGLWCKDEECCVNCDEKEDSKKRHTLNKIMAAHMNLNAIIYKNQVNFLGLSCVTANDLKNVADVYQLQKTLKGLLDNCGECKGAKIYNSKPCKTC